MDDYVTQQHIRGASTFDLVAKATRLAEDFAKRAAVHDQAGSAPEENLKALHKAGLLNLTIPASMDDSGVGLACTSAVVAAVARGDSATALILTMHYVHQRAIFDAPHCSEQLKREIVVNSVNELALVNALRVEPEMGAPNRGGLPTTIAHAINGGWSIRGRKTYATGASLLRWALVWALTDESEPRIGEFLVPLNGDSVKVEKTWDHLGMRASCSDDVVFEDVFIPSEAAIDLRKPTEWSAKNGINTLDSMRMIRFVLTISSLYDGIARAARDWLIRYGNNRQPINLGTSLSKLPRYQETLGRIDALLLVNKQLIGSAVERFDTAVDSIDMDEVGLIKYVVTGNVVQIVESGLDLVGNAGLSRHNPLERYYRDVLCSKIHVPQNDTILLAAGSRALNI